MKSVSFFIGALFLLSGCSDSGSSNNPYTPLNDENRQILKQVNRDLGKTSYSINNQIDRDRGLHSVEECQSTIPGACPDENRSELFALSVNNSTGSATPVKTAQNTNPYSLEDDFLLDFEQDGCRFDVIEKEPLSNEHREIPNFEFKTLGGDCPAAINMTMNGTVANETDLSVNFAISMVISNPDLIEEAQFSSVQMNVALSNKFQPLANSGLKTITQGKLSSNAMHIVHGSVIVDSQFTAEVEMGELPTDSPGEGIVFPEPSNAINNNGDIPDFFGGMKQKVSERHQIRVGDSLNVLFESNFVMNGIFDVKGSYKINGNVVSEEEYLAVFQSLDVPGYDWGSGDSVEQDSGVITNPIPPTAFVSCAVSVFDANVVSMDQLREHANNNEVYMLPEVGNTWVDSDASQVGGDGFIYLPDGNELNVTLSLENSIATINYEIPDQFQTSAPFSIAETSEIKMITPLPGYHSYAECR